jgi:hypothetical protein
MNPRSVVASFAFLALCLAATFAQPKVVPISPDTPKEEPVTAHAKGTFEVKLTPQTDDLTQDSTLGRMTIDKQLHGDLEAASKGQMLTASTDVKGSGVYVAVERVTGKLNGRAGSFSLHHTGIMERGTPHLEISVVSDSGTGELVGITGKFRVTISDGKHFYDFEYTLRPEP